MADDITVIVVTGGPKAGKSTVIRWLLAQYSPLITVVEETATKLFSSGLTPPKTPEQRRSFQRVVLSYQRYSEDDLFEEARRLGAKVVLLDRGVLDSAAYIDGGVEEVLRMIGRTKEQVFEGIDMVLHLETVALFDPSLFDNHGNQYRVELSAIEAQKLDARIRQAWIDHDDWRPISGRAGIQSVIEQVDAILQQVLFREVERKWVLPSMPIDLPEPLAVMEIEQYYLRIKEDAEIRYRRITQDGVSRYEETKKFGHGLDRREFESPKLPEIAFQSFYPSSPRSVIHKTRYLFPDGGNSVISMDEFHGENEGLVALEREFSRPEVAKKYKISNYWKDRGAKEVTGDKKYSNASLAGHILHWLISG